MLCTLTTRKIVLGHFSLGRDIKKPIDQGPSVYPVRAFQSESALRKIHRTTGEQVVTEQKQVRCRKDQ